MRILGGFARELVRPTGYSSHIMGALLSQADHVRKKKSTLEVLMLYIPTKNNSTLPETNSSHLKIDPWKFGDSGIGNHHFGEGNTYPLKRNLFHIKSNQM